MTETTLLKKSNAGEGGPERRQLFVLEFGVKRFL